ncbi:MAG: DUF2752 domain-containing protein [Pirellulaceae bacterium]
MTTNDVRAAAVETGTRDTSRLRLEGNGSNSVAAQLHWIFLIASLAILFAALALRPPTQSQLSVPGSHLAMPELCMSRRIIGLSCPGCGLTRTFVSLAHGQWEAAWRYNPVGILLFVAVAFQVPLRILQLWRIGCEKPPIDLRWGYGIMIAICIALFVQWIVRFSLGTLP